MYVEDGVHVLAGLFVLISVTLGYFWTPWWFLFTAFVGANLFQYGLSKFCPLGLLLKRLGLPPLPRGKCPGG